MCSRILFCAFLLSVANGCAPSGPDHDHEEVELSKKTGETVAADKKPGVDQELQRIIGEVEAAITDRDWGTARQLIEKGLGLTGENNPDLDLQRAELLLKLGDVERENGRETEARRQYTDATAIFHVLKNVDGGFKTCLSVGQLELQKGDYAAAARQFDEAESLTPKLKDSALVGELRVHKGRLASRRVNPAEAKESLLEAIKIFEERRDKESMAETYLLVSQEEDALGRGGACQSYLDRAAAIFRDLGDLDGEARATHRMAALAERDKRYKKARQLFKKVAELYDKLDDQTAATNVRRHLDALPEPD